MVNTHKVVNGTAYHKDMVDKVHSTAKQAKRHVDFILGKRFSR